MKLEFTEIDLEKWSRAPYFQLYTQMIPPENGCMIGALPWTSFTSYSSIPYASSNQYFPILESGKFKMIDGKLMMPFSITVHHAVADGYHVGQFLDELQEIMNKPETWAE